MKEWLRNVLLFRSYSEVLVCWVSLHLANAECPDADFGDLSSKRVKSGLTGGEGKSLGGCGC